VPVNYLVLLLQSSGADPVAIAVSTVDPSRFESEPSRPWRIAQVITRSDTIGGAHVHVRDLCLALRQRGHDVTVLVGGNGPFVEELARCSIPFRLLPALVRRIHPWHDAAAVLQLRRVLRELRPDLVSTHSSKAGWLGRIAARSLGIPVIYTAHGWPFTPGARGIGPRLYKFAERIAAPFANRIITVSRFDENLARQHGIGRRGQVIAVHNGVVDVPPSMRSSPEKVPPRIVMIARLDAQKDHDTLLRALAQLAKLEWTVELLGDGPGESACRELARRLGIEGRIQFSGLQGDVARRLARSQLLVLFSNYEGLPLSVLEGMRAGLPVVASAVGGVSECVQDGWTGILVPPRDVSAGRAALERLLSSPMLRKQMGDAGRARYEEIFTLDRMVDQTLSVYSDAIPPLAARRDVQESPAPPMQVA
jgi:glycosyltransferase involved in cell wall biosynthesis